MERRLMLLFMLQLIVQHIQSQSVITNESETPSWSDDINEDNADEVDWSKHPCRRDCKDDEPPRECRYVFRAEEYLSMSRACYDCPGNATDCFRPHCVPVDGVQRPLVVVNRQLPGPSVEVCEGDRVIVDVVNMLMADGTTIHWHGQHMSTSPYMDGTPFVSQCPIMSGETFQYDFIAATPGTHFWHSHIGLQRNDGMFGPLIVRRAPKTNQLHNLYDYDVHHLILSDWDHETGAKKYLAHFHGRGNSNPTNLLINGLGNLGSGPKNKELTGTLPTATFVVKKGFRYRFRIVNAGFLNCPIEMSIDNHTMQVVSSDGRDINPVKVDSLVTYAGERFDIIVEMNKDIGNYWMRFRGQIECKSSFAKAHQVAILRYSGAPESNPVADVAYELPRSEDIPLQINPLNRGTEATDVMSIAKVTALDKDSEDNMRNPDHQFYIFYDLYKKNNPKYLRDKLYGFNQTKHKVYISQLNHISMKKPKFPLMSQTEMIDSRKLCNSSTVKNCENVHCACPHVLQVKLNSVVELVLIDEGKLADINHPFHLHGHSFRVMAMERMGKSVTVAEVRKADEEGRISRRFSGAPIKDTVTVPDGGYTIVRFYANNPGYWLFHCHLEFHSELGMALIFKVGEHEDFAPVPEEFPRCGTSRPLRPTSSTAAGYKPMVSTTTQENKSTMSPMTLEDKSTTSAS